MAKFFEANANETKRKSRILALIATFVAVLFISGTAIYAQNLTKFFVEKRITGPSGAPALTGLNFGVYANCNPIAFRNSFVLYRRLDIIDLKGKLAVVSRFGE